MPRISVSGYEKPELTLLSAAAMLKRTDNELCRQGSKSLYPECVLSSWSSQWLDFSAKKLYMFAGTACECLSKCLKQFQVLVLLCFVKDIIMITDIIRLEWLGC